MDIDRALVAFSCFSRRHPITAPARICSQGSCFRASACFYVSHFPKRVHLLIVPLPVHDFEDLASGSLFASWPSSWISNGGQWLKEQPSSRFAWLTGTGKAALSCILHTVMFLLGRQACFHAASAVPSPFRCSRLIATKEHTVQTPRNGRKFRKIPTTSRHVKLRERHCWIEPGLLFACPAFDLAKNKNTS